MAKPHSGHRNRAGPRSLGETGARRLPHLGLVPYSTRHMETNTVPEAGRNLPRLPACAGSQGAGLGKIWQDHPFDQDQTPFEPNTLRKTDSRTGSVIRCSKRFDT